MQTNGLCTACSVLPCICHSICTVSHACIVCICHNTSRPAGATAADARKARRPGGSAGCEGPLPPSPPFHFFFPRPRDLRALGLLRLPDAPCWPGLPCELPPACIVAGASGLAGRSVGISAWSCLAAGGCPSVSGLLLPAVGPATAICVGCGVVGVWSAFLGVEAGASEGWLGVVAEGVWCLSRAGIVKASRAARGGREIVGGAGSWGWGGVVEGLVGTAGAARRGKSVGVSSIPGDDRRLFSTFPGLVVNARFARIGLATADNAIWRARSANLAPESIPEIPAEATTAFGTATTFPASPDAFTSPAEVSARCRLCSCDCGLLAS